MHNVLSTIVRNTSLALLAATFVAQAALPSFAVESITIQSPASASKIIPEAWRKSAPKLPPPRPFSMPNFVSYTLDNGLDVQLLEDHRVPFITVDLGIKAGSSLDPKSQLGIASMTADLINEGTKTKKSKEIAETIDSIGGGLQAAADPDFTFIVGSALSKYTDTLFQTVSDVVLNPSFPEDEFKLNKTNLLQELVMKRSEPDFLLDERFAKAIFGEHPYSVVAPKPETVEKITADDLKDFHSKYYVPNRAVLVVVGDFNTDKMKDLIAANFGGDKWKQGKLSAQDLPKPPSQSGRHILVVDRPGSVQSAIKLGNVGIKKTDPDFFPLLVCNQILGGGSNARLFLNIREQKGYTYGAYSAFSARREPGSFAADAQVRTEVTAPSLQEFLYELERIRNVRVGDKEIQDAKTYLAGTFQLGLETQSGLAQRLLEVEMYELPKDYLTTYADKIMAITPDQIRDAARKYIDLNNIVITIVGDSAKITPELEYFGPIEIYDAQGNPEKSTASSVKPGA